MYKYAFTFVLLCLLFDGNSYPNNAICTNSNWVKYVRINYHFISDDTGEGNFGMHTTNVPFPSYIKNGYQYAQAIVKNANQQLLQNKKMNMPALNKTAVLPIRLQYILDSVYFHQDSYWEQGGDFYQNFDLHYQYAQGQDSIINVYDTGSKPKNYPEGVSSFTKRAVKLFSPYQGFVKSIQNATLQDHLSSVGRLLNHELGHVFGLEHTWSFWTFDGCDDTPTHCNCWNFDAKNKNCNTWDKVSNNIMDYNPYIAYTPCQIKKTHQNLNTYNNAYIAKCKKCD